MQDTEMERQYMEHARKSLIQNLKKHTYLLYFIIFTLNQLQIPEDITNYIKHLLLAGKYSDYPGGMLHNEKNNIIESELNNFVDKLDREFCLSIKKLRTITPTTRFIISQRSRPLT